MYTQRDRDQIRQRIIKYCAITLPLVAALIAGYVIGLKQRLEAWVMVDGCLIFAVICFMWCMYLYPSIRYARFLKDMGIGLTRELQGCVVEVAQQEEVQDGVRVLPVRILLTKEEDERIVYLNVCKAENFPAAGVEVRLKCFGRHIKEVAAV